MHGEPRKDSNTYQKLLARNAAVCGAKIHFGSHEVARMAAERFMAETGEEMWTYRCRKCAGWHMTSIMPKHVRKKRRLRELEARLSLLLGEGSK